MSGVSTGIDETVLVNGKPISYGEITEAFTQYQYDDQSSGYAEGNTGPSSSDGYNLQAWRTQPLIDADGALYHVVDEGMGNFNVTKEAGGSTEWTYSLPDDAYTGAIVDGVLYISSRDNTLFAINTGDGSAKWSYSYPNGYGGEGRPLVVDGTVYVGNDENLYAINAADGSLQWKFTADASYYAKPSWWDGTLLAVSDNNNNLYGIDPSDGSEMWRYTTDVGNGGAPAIKDGVAYVGRYTPGVSAINVADGSVKWESSTSGAVYNGVAVHPDAVVTGDYDGNLYGFDPADGTELWRISKSGRQRNPPIVVGGVAHHVLDETYYAVDIASQSVVYTVAANGIVATPASPVGGTLYAPAGQSF